MNVQLPGHIDKPTFLAWVQGREGRYELVQGRVVMMTGASREHGKIVSNLVALLRSQIDLGQWDVIAEFGLDAGPNTLRYPDVVVDRPSGRRGDYTATAPALLIEILSPSSRANDLRDKPIEYLQLTSLQAYLVLSQDEAAAWLWKRVDRAFPPIPVEIFGLDKVIRIDAPCLELPLEAIYAGVIL
jgi:Uma2 family endonuclease